MKIFVGMLSGKVLALNVENTDTVASVKKKVEDEEGIPPERQILVFSGEQLEDRKTLRECGVCEECTLYVVIRKKFGMSILVKTTTGKTFTLNVERTDTIEAVKRKIQDKGGIRAEQQILMFSGERLEEGKTLRDYGVEKEDIVRLVYKISKMQLCLKGTHGRDDYLNAESKDAIGYSVEYVKQKIQGQEGIPSELQSLVFAGKELEDGKLLQDYHVQEDDTLRLALRQASKMHIFVKIGSGKSIALEVSSTDTIGQVKEKIANREGIPFGEQQVMFGGEQLEDGRTLEECGVEREDTLRVVFKAKQMRICVKEMSGSDIGVEVLSTDTVGRVKQKIQERRGVPRDLQTLVFAGAPLEDEKTLRHYNIVDEAVLYLMLRIGF
ncbi:putative polyubiquitin [Monocercomonoides exilis]|uniref:putative polyubiquitin n=1 Tax=Monocercomonoides exilis TaxID=2049356 RepID=UPI00355A1B3B|nr:putative polyubiquitin [Monocercomonoides exilis]|eukprot:MONOS_3987.1-p1 / transcript=MONOS_3987.1 / gene=MONOS_3987 / organism=Monocercomonoides_exilis_PA203 / gene_product=polyubiquitin / transcript_product=polyubiquitin / location=Mono_scaffold00100:24248-25892(+) / protein_length=381 / sequence_SO=supercontig / SO=protein_coding / is_pseudo=false